MPKENRLYVTAELRERDFGYLAKRLINLQEAEALALQMGIEVDVNLEDYERYLELLIPTDRLTEVFEGLRTRGISYGTLDLHDEAARAVADELVKEDPSLIVEDMFEEGESESACSECGPTIGVESTYCGSFCEECLKEHMAGCEICAKEFQR